MTENDYQSKVDHDQLVETTARLTQLLSGTGVSQLKVSVGSYTWDITTTSPTAPAAAEPVAGSQGGSASAIEAAVPEPPGHPVTAPVVGVFYRSPSPNAAPFVTEGQEVAAGDQLAIVEAMKMMNSVVAPCAGVVREIHCADTDIVEYGARLFTLDPTDPA
ncbi:acetyl-CoA carboxylase biotin carboxyl carrier protein [Streptomyces gobiensis]|uniref:acetyl-CoA carboxylase biotin carboxyl carrier protein n=1 Tax=Streptomyces gobiensis TaxID=2875706 RepID=UPI001E57704E|nr:acetyl-CoA carboxylase biotin carboxyl carrier protein subunit [Streptomyces gobiensis]UGY94213.1 hypothetical protein test1122_22445 [Streptomyces gobiensis]